MAECSDVVSLFASSSAFGHIPTPRRNEVHRKPVQILFPHSFFPHGITYYGHSTRKQGANARTRIRFGETLVDGATRGRQRLLSRPCWLVKQRRSDVAANRLIRNVCPVFIDRFQIFFFSRLATPRRLAKRTTSLTAPSSGSRRPQSRALDARVHKVPTPYTVTHLALGMPSTPTRSRVRCLSVPQLQGSSNVVLANGSSR